MAEYWQQTYVWVLKISETLDCVLSVSICNPLWIPLLICNFFKEKTFDFLLSDVDSDTFPDRSCGVSAWCVSRCDKSHTCAVKSDIVLGLSSSKLPLFGVFGVKRWQVCVCEYLTDSDCVLTRCSLRCRAHSADYYSQLAPYFSIC